VPRKYQAGFYLEGCKNFLAGRSNFLSGRCVGAVEVLSELGLDNRSFCPPETINNLEQVRIQRLNPVLDPGQRRTMPSVRPPPHAARLWRYLYCPELTVVTQLAANVFHRPKLPTFGVVRCAAYQRPLQCRHAILPVILDVDPTGRRIRGPWPRIALASLPSIK
jgi:hypothetical protein